MLRKNELTRFDLTGSSIIPPELESNLAETRFRINEFIDLYGKKVTVTSFFRTKEDQVRIYKAKGITDISKIPMKSRHLFCQAVDLHDPDSAIHDFCMNHQKEIRKIGLWLENRKGNWQHFQTTPFASYKEGGTIFFEP